MLDTLITFGKHQGKTIQQLCDMGEYEYLRYISTLDMTRTTKKCVDVIRVFVAEMEKELLEYRQEFTNYVIEQVKPIVSCLKFACIQRGLQGKGQSLFLTSIQEKLEMGVIPRGQHVRELVVDLAAKSKGHRNSNVYKQSLESFQGILQNILQAEKNLIEMTEKIANNRQTPREIPHVK